MTDPLRILVIEDEPGDFLLLQRHLQSRQLAARCTRVDSNAALDAALASEWDIVLSDYSVPGMSFQTTLAKLRAHDPLLPVILVSGSIGEELAIELLHGGLADFVLKDRMARLGGAICHAIEAAQSRRRLEQAQRALAASEQNFRAMFEGSPTLMLALDPTTLRVKLANRNALQMLGYTAEEVLGTPIDDLTHPDDLELTHARNSQLLAGELAAVRLEKRYLRKDGSTFWAETSASALTDGEGRVTLLVGSAVDITARRHDEEQLRVAAIAFETQDGMLVTDASGVIQRVNGAFCRITGYSADEVVGKTPAILQSGRHDGAFYANMWDTLAREGYWHGELCNRHRNGEFFTERLAISAVRDPSGAVTHYVGSLNDVTKEREAQAKAEHLENFDALTELPNRSLLYDRIEHALAGSTRSQQLGALMLIDLDQFKHINDSFGHKVGDALLALGAHRLRLAVREGDTVGRFGGDKFIVLVEDLGRDAPTAARLAGTIAEKLRASMAEKYVLGAERLLCSVSVGLTMFHGGDVAVESVLKQAELAMYRAKTEGRNTVRFFLPEMQEALDTRNALESDLREGLDHDQFVLHYQAQLDRAHRIVGAEALVRWNHPRRGLTYPGAFIALAEETGLILPLGQWVLERACAQLRAWADDPVMRELRVAVNVSVRQFRQSDFVARVRDALMRSGAEPTRLKIEITESLVLDDLDDAFAKMGALKALGVGISLDDFGTGSSSLSYLTRLPLDQLKIDQSFVRNLPTVGNDAMVAQTIIAMAKGLGLEVIAEGVETAPQLDFLTRHGCDAFQGFYFGRPMPADAFEQSAQHQGQRSYA